MLNGSSWLKGRVGPKPVVGCAWACVTSGVTIQAAV
jgi:hypothetical protein